MIGKDFSILITTKNRVDELKITLEKCLPYIRDHGVSCIVYDDGSSDGTSKFVLENFPQVKLLTNNSSKGYLYNRNVMLNSVNTKYAISLDDDSNFLSENVLFTIDDYFLKTDQCGLLALRIFWGETTPLVAVYTGDKLLLFDGRLTYRLSQSGPQGQTPKSLRYN